MELWTADFWLVVTAASTFATVLATILTLAVTAWWRKLDSLEADWAPHAERPSWEPPYRATDRSVPTLEFKLANAGDGTAFRMEIRGQHCTVAMGEYGTSSIGLAHRAERAMLPAMHPGDEIRVWVECDPRLWDAAGLVITWKRSPTWRKKHSQRAATIGLSEIAPRPVFGKDIDDGTGNYVRKPLPEPDQPPLTAEQTAALSRAGKRRLPWRRD